MTRGLRPIASPFVAAPPAGVRVRTRLTVSEDDAIVLAGLGAHLGRLAGSDLSGRCAQGRLDAKGKAASRQGRKRALTAAASSRWAGAITRTSEDAWSLAERNLQAEGRSLRARIGRIRRRLAAPVGGSSGRNRGYTSQQERWQKQQRLQALQARLVEVDARLSAARLAVCRGGRGLAKARHNLADAGLDEERWRARWQSQRWFITADGEADKRWGNETIRWHPDQEWLEIKLPAPLAHLANRPHGRWRLSAPVSFAYRGHDVAAQAATGAVRYDVSYHADKDRWYLDASWKTADATPVSLAELRRRPVLAVDVNAGHLAAWVLDPAGNPTGAAATIALNAAGMSASTRDGRLRAPMSDLVRMAETAGAKAIVVEDLDFVAAREQGRERAGRRPSRGQRGRSFRRLVAGIPTARFRERLTQMAANTGVAVIVVDPAYTSRWGAQHWLGALRQQFSPNTTGHHAAAVVIGRRGLGQRARRRERCDSTRPEDRQQRATDSAVRPTPASTGMTGQRTRKPGDRKAQGQPHPGRKTRPAERASPGHQGGEDRSHRPELAMSHSLPR